MRNVYLRTHSMPGFVIVALHVLVLSSSIALATLEIL